jgi:hypothetical protein
LCLDVWRRLMFTDLMGVLGFAARRVVRCRWCLLVLAALGSSPGLAVGGQSSPDCDDNNACTIDWGDPEAGTCVHEPITCTALDQCHDEGTCDPWTGVCSDPPKADGSACDDGNACTQNDACQAGECTSFDPVICPALDQCHDEGVCDPWTGVCSNPSKDDGSYCDDGNACTQTDWCQGGACTGFDPITCTALDQCHDEGTCDPWTGICPDPEKPDGSACDDGEGCTQPDTCQAGICMGSATDADGDGVLDPCDLCPGHNDYVDSDGDGVADGCDLCPSLDNHLDCNNNGISDCDELTTTGLIGSYFRSEDFSGSPAVRIDQGVNFQWGLDAPLPGFGIDHFSVRWTGYIQTDAAGTSSFITYSDDGVRLWVNGQLLINDWNSHPWTRNSAVIQLAANGVYELTLEYFDDYLGAAVQLNWMRPGGAEELIPAGALMPGRDCNNNLILDVCDPDGDGDGTTDDCDICQGFDDGVDADGDSVPDGCDRCPGSDDRNESDGDGVPDGCDVCPNADDSADADGDGVPDGCDVCPNTIAGAHVGAEGCPSPALPPDFDNDGDVDGEDFARFAACSSGPDVALSIDCDPADFDRDGDSDLDEFGLVQKCFSGANNPADPHCAD